MWQETELTTRPFYLIVRHWHQRCHVDNHWPLSECNIPVQWWIPDFSFISSSSSTSHVPVLYFNICFTYLSSFSSVNSYQIPFKLIFISKSSIVFFMPSLCSVASIFTPTVSLAELNKLSSSVYSQFTDTKTTRDCQCHIGICSGSLLPR
jgi:hypothetical protein